jgi:hypothetical protein
LIARERGEGSPGSGRRFKRHRARDYIKKG